MNRRQALGVIDALLELEESRKAEIKRLRVALDRELGPPGPHGLLAEKLEVITKLATERYGQNGRVTIS